MRRRRALPAPLRASDFAGIRVGSSPNKTADHLITQMKQTINQRDGGWMHTLYKNATGIRVLFEMKPHDAMSKLIDKLSKFPSNAAFLKAIEG